MRASYITIILISVLFLSGCAYRSEENNIRKSLIGMELKYNDIAGNERTYEVKENDIQSIQKTSDGYVAKVGKTMQWSIYFDKNGKKTKEEQLFIS